MDEKQKYLNIYNGLHDDQAATATLHGKMGGGYGRICWGENMLETLKNWGVASLLDVGCGYGNFCDAASLFVPRVYGLDIASVASGKVIDNPEITYFDSEAKSLPLERNVVEWITSFDCLEHCLEEDIDAILNEFDRVASKGFVLSISYVPCEKDGMPLHMTVKPEAWWIDKLSKFGVVTKQGNAPITGVPYLVCSKPVERNLICYCAGSLGTRLRSLAWAADLARRTRRNLVLLWLSNDPLCRTAFSELFDAPLAQIPEDGLLDLSECKIYAPIKAVADQALISGGMALRRAVQKWGCHQWTDRSVDDNAANLLIYEPAPRDWSASHAGLAQLCQWPPVARIMDRYHHLKMEMNIGKQVMGVHARGTDFGIPVEAYARLMARAMELNPDQQFLVVSDDAAYERELSQRFGKHVLIRPKSGWNQKKAGRLPWSIDNVDSSGTSVSESLIDLYLLAGTDFKIYHESSAYALLADGLSKVPPTDIGALKPPRPAGRAMATERAVQHNPRVSAGHEKPGAGQHVIYYVCPDDTTPSASSRHLYRHVALLHKAGFTAFILHENQVDVVPGMPIAPVRHLGQVEHDKKTIFVIPEDMPRIMHRLKPHPGRRFVYALKWHDVFSSLPDGLDWRDFHIERVMVASPEIGQMVSWSMGLPVHQIETRIDHKRFYHDPGCKDRRIVYIKAESDHMEKLKRLLEARNPDYINKIKWVQMEHPSAKSPAASVRQASIFLTTGIAEGFPSSCIEAMAAGAIVAGYASAGGNKILCGDGDHPNCILAPCGDYVSLAHQITPLLDGLLQLDMSPWDALVANARHTAQAYGDKTEAESLLRFWRQYVQPPSDKQPNAEVHTRSEWHHREEANGAQASPHQLEA